MSGSTGWCPGAATRSSRSSSPPGSWRATAPTPILAPKPREDYLGPRIRRKEEESGLRREQAAAAVHEEYELELLRRMEAICREVQQRSAVEVWRKRPPSKANRHVGVDRPAALRPARGNQEKGRGWEPGSR